MRGHKQLSRLSSGLIALLLTIAACQPGADSAQSAGATATARIQARVSWTAVPSVTPPRPTSTPLPSATATTAATPTASSTPEAAPPPSATPLPPIPEHFEGNFLFRRPFDQPYTTYWARTYAYGSTDRGQRQVHHGVDIANPAESPILAAADGIVYYAGADIEVVFGPKPAFYGNLVVIEHPFMYSDGARIYSLYGHMSRTAVYNGQEVKAGQLIGYVGATGVALGPHLHFEVRVGDPVSYGATRNPELWIAPYSNAGILAGRVTDLQGNRLEGVQVEVKAETSYYIGFSYTGHSVNSDPYLNENLVIPDIVAGYHTVTVTLADEIQRFRQTVYVWPGEITWLDIRIQP